MALQLIPCLTSGERLLLLNPNCMRSISFTAFLGAVAFFLCISLATAGPLNSVCDELLLTEQMQWDRSELIQLKRDELVHDMKHPLQLLQQRRVKSAELKFLKFLGRGHQGHVYLVEKKGELMALKLFRSEFSDSFFSSYIIQHHLAALNMAPQVYGNLNLKEVQSFISEGLPHELRPSSELSFKYGVLMEYVDEDFLRDRSEAMLVTLEEKKRLQAQALEYLNVVSRLGIYVDDVDAVITSDRRLLLVDFGYYKVFQTEVPVSRVAQANSIAQNLLVFSVQKRTSSFQDRLATLRARLWQFGEFFSASEEGG